MTPDYWNNQLSAWRGAKQYEAANPNMLRRVGMGRPQGESLVRPMGFNNVISYQPRQSPIGRPTSSDAVGYAQYRNQLQTSDPIIRGFAGYLERTNQANPNTVMRDLETNGIGAYAKHVPEYEDWRIRETLRRNAGGLLSSTFGRLLTTLGPALITGGASLPLAGRMATGAAFGGMANGPVGAITGGLAAGIAPNIRLPGFREAITAPGQAVQSVVSQMTPTNLLRAAASQGVGMAAPSASPKSTYQANPLRR